MLIVDDASAYREKLRFLAAFQHEYLRENLFRLLSEVVRLEIVDQIGAQRSLESPETAAKFGLYYFAFARAGAEGGPYRSIALKLFEKPKVARLEDV
jgi:hypothetical protein